MQVIVHSRRVVFPDGVQAASIAIDNGRIAAIGPIGQRLAAAVVIDAGDDVVLPGLVDTHVHVNEPGRTEWEGFDTATRAAAAGGITTLVDMPLNSIPSTTTADALERKRAAAGGRCHVDVGFWGGVVPGNRDDLAPLAAGGVLGFKCFLSPSGVDEFHHVGERELREALPVIARLGLPLLVHAEWPALLRDPAAARDGHSADPTSYATWLNSRPPASELAAIERLILLAREFGARIHVVHLATAAALPMLAAARADGVPITVETCPHYLTFAAEQIPDRRPDFKCAPPIRAGSEREGLWDGLARGVIDLIASDHSPAPRALKRVTEGDFLQAWGGIASLQVAASAVWTGMAERHLDIASLARWMSAAPARLAGLAARKGAIAPGMDADLVIFDPDAEWTVDARTLYHRHPVTPYDGMRLRGRVKTTFLGGRIVFDDKCCRGPARGALLTAPLA